MSFQAMTWAIEQTCSSSGQKLALLMLANHSNGHTGKCTPAAASVMSPSSRPRGQHERADCKGAAVRH